MRRHLLAAAMALIGLSACGGEERSDGAGGEAPTAAEGAGSTAATPGQAQTAELPAATTAQGFALRAAQSDMFEIQSSRLALERTQNPQIRTYAQRMIDEHQVMSNQMGAALAQAGVTVAMPAELDAEKAGMLSQLQGSGPADFDRRYVEQQIEGHQSALNLFRDFGGNGDTPALQELANRGAPMIENHLQAAQAIEKGLGGAS